MGIITPIITYETATKQGIYSLDGQKLRDKASQLRELPAGLHLLLRRGQQVPGRAAGEEIERAVPQQVRRQKLDVTPGARA